MTEGNLREILGELGIKVVGKNSDDWLLVPCPFAAYGFHKHPIDRNPSMFAKINPTGHSGFQCFACKQTGSIHALVKKIEHYSGESYGSLAIRAKLKEMECGFAEYGEHENESYEEPKPVPDAVWRGLFPLAWDSAQARGYLESRGISQHTSALIGLLWDAKDKRILFPIRDGQGNVYGFTGRSTLDQEDFPHPRHKKVKDYLGLPKSRLLLGMDLIQEGKPTLLVEGLFAYAHLIEIGAREVCNPVASMGSHLSDEQAELLIDFQAPAYLLYDDDLAGDIGLLGKLVDGQHQGGGAVDNDNALHVSRRRGGRG